ncbi:MAG TPA: molybdopterin cofactor-binding domain-containing protein [Alphaproteobacteria bacterium]|nr:molybdopterin cofactor-binding domain-containing protein [Alphaproteobacteria bacterium]
MNAPALPLSLTANPRLDRWIKFQDDRNVRIASGKVEIGQGIVTALSQIAAEELDVPLDRVRLLSGSTEEGPDELYTSSSLSIMVSGTSIRLVCAEARLMLTEQAALRLNCSPEDLSVRDGAFYLDDGTATGLDYWDLAPALDFSQPPTGRATPKPVSAHRIVGSNLPRLDLPAKLTGGGFLHDFARPGMLHARTLRQPGPEAQLDSLDEEAVRRASRDPALKVVRRANFAAFLSDHEYMAERAAGAAERLAVWRNARDIDQAAQEGRWLIGQPSIDRAIGDEGTPPPGLKTMEATYTRPYIAHASLGPSAAVAEYSDGHLTVWSHGQGMHPLRKNIAAALGMPVEEITCHHLHGPGCYGHNGADDAALDAAIVAMELPGTPVRLQWRREEEFRHEPVSPAMAVTVRVAVDEQGKPADWTMEIWSGTHVQRPGTTSGYLLAATALENPPPPVEPTDPPEERGGGGTRNALPWYDIPAKRIVHHLVRHVPVRTSALRGLGAPTNIFALESMIDELAARAGEDPLAYRIGLLSDPRARTVLERTAEMAGWQNRGKGGDGGGLGIAFARYKNMAAYSAVAVAVTVDEQVRLDHIWSVTDAGLVINPDGLKNQLEGGILQGASFALKERVLIEGDGIRSRNWDTYPILRFSEVPAVDVALIQPNGHPPLGVGECTVAPTCAAIGNAVAHALGQRIYDMPLDRDRIMQALLKAENTC